MAFHSNQNVRATKDIGAIQGLVFEEIPATVQSQYAASPNMNALVESFLNILPNKDIELFYNSIFNIYTASGIGLDIWGRILGVGRLIEVQSSEYFGFIGSGLKPFGQAPFFYKGLTNAYRMADDAYRQYLLLVKAYANIASADAYTLNAILAMVFPGKIQYVLNVGIMQIRFVFEYYLTPVERAILRQGLLTRGAGVGYEYIEVDKPTTFGFAGSNLQPFDKGTFTPFAQVIQ